MKYKPRSAYWDASVGETVLMPATANVETSDPAPVFCGLYDANGHKLFRVPETVPLGFHIERKS